jgi:hypothetical protein
MRVYPKGVDFIEYYRYLHYFSFDIRHIREIVYFFTSYIIYTISHNEIISFLILDTIWMYVLFNIQKELNFKYKTKNYIFVIILFTSFPLFFGYENIYRQLFAEIFSLYAYVIRQRNSSKSNLFFLLAIFSHNIALVILPFLIIKKFFNLNFNVRLFLTTLVSISFIFLFSIASHYKSGHNTGLDMSIFYFLIFIILFYIYIIKNKFNLFMFVNKFSSIYIGTILLFGLILLPIGMVAERMGMFFLMFVIYDLYVYSCIMSKKKQILFRLGLLLSFSLPVLIFDSSRMML